MGFNARTSKAVLLPLSVVLVLVGTGLVGHLLFQPGMLGGASRDPAIIRVGVLPDEEEATLQTRYTPLLSHLSATVGREFELAIPADYRELVGWFGDGTIDLAYFGGLTFAQAFVHHHAKPLVMRDIDTRFFSYYLAAGGSPARGLAEFEGRRIAFGDRLSTSGHLMPRHFFIQKFGVSPETYFSEVRYSGAHDRTAYMVRDGLADLGVANALIINRMLQDGRLAEGDVAIVDVTPFYPDYVWAVSEHLEEPVQVSIRDAFLELEVDDEEDRLVLQQLDAASFLPAGDRDFRQLVDIASKLGLLDEGRAR